MKTRILLLAGALLLAAAPADGQNGTISPGMTTDQVRAAFGEPATWRAQGEWTYWYYHNGCPRRCGSDDVVFFRDGRVVTAVLRTPRRRVTGPRADDALEQAQDAPATVGRIRIESAPPEEPVDGTPRAANIRAGATTGGSLRVDGSVELGSTTIIVTPHADPRARRR